MRPINRFLLQSGQTIARNPCVSPDFCLDWTALRIKITAGATGEIVTHPKSSFETANGSWALAEDLVSGDCAWKLSTSGPEGTPVGLADGAPSGGDIYYPATWENLLRLKNLIQHRDPESTVFPSAGGKLGKGTLGVGARFTTLHWPAVEWAMSALQLGVTANQNSIPRELVYDVDAMLEGRLGTVPFPFIGTNVPEGHQGQSVEGMSHGCVLSKLRHGFHRRRIAWSFNADHQPIGGAFDAREDALVAGCLLASYITFDLSPELALKRPARMEDIEPKVVDAVRARVSAAGLSVDPSAFNSLILSVWPAMQKMKRRDEKYRASRERAFTAPEGRRYLRELSIDELPGLTTPETTAVMLALCEALGMPVNFIAPAFGFQKNLPYPDDAALRPLIERQWAVAKNFGVSIGFHSGSGKSADNYRVMGDVTGGHLEIKTSGRYTYEMGVALFRSTHPSDQTLWRDWYRFTVELAVSGAFSADPTESRMARTFVADSLSGAGRATDVFGSPQACRAAVDALAPGPDHMFFFEYNFLFVLAAGGKADKAVLGDHSASGYAQRARFYAISPEARLLYAKGVASYIVFLAEHTGLVAPERCAAVGRLLARVTTYSEFLDEISK
jgi:hypothetical protein